MVKVDNEETVKSRQHELEQRLAAIADEDVDTSDLSERRDWSKAERGRFYRSQTRERQGTP